jgi:hypothetical protein
MMQRSFLYALVATPAFGWTQPRVGYVPGNDYGIPQNASYDYVVVGGGQYSRRYDVMGPVINTPRNLWSDYSISLG